MNASSAVLILVRRILAWPPGMVTSARPVHSRSHTFVRSTSSLSSTPQGALRPGQGLTLVTSKLERIS